MIPRINEVMMMKTSAVLIRISVIGRRCWIKAKTGCFEKKEVPKLP